MSGKDKVSEQGLLSLVLAKGSQPDKEKFERIMFPVKQILGLALGILCGYLQLTGIFTLAM